MSLSQTQTDTLMSKWRTHGPPSKEEAKRPAELPKHDPVKFKQVRENLASARGTANAAMGDAFILIISGRMASSGDDLRHMDAMNVVKLALSVFSKAGVEVPEGELVTGCERACINERQLSAAALREVEFANPGLQGRTKAADYPKKIALEIYAFSRGTRQVCSFEHNGRAVTLEKPRGRVDPKGRRYPKGISMFLSDSGIAPYDLKKRCSSWPDSKGDVAWDLFLFWLVIPETLEQCVAAMYLAVEGEKAFPSPEFGRKPYSKILATTGWRTNSYQGAAAGSLGKKHQRSKAGGKVAETAKCLAIVPLGPFAYSSEIMCWCMEEAGGIQTDHADKWAEAVSRKRDFRNPLKTTFGMEYTSTTSERWRTLLCKKTAEQMLRTRDEVSERARDKPNALKSAPSGMRKNRASAPVYFESVSMAEVFGEPAEIFSGTDVDSEEDSDSDAEDSVGGRRSHSGSEDSETEETGRDSETGSDTDSSANDKRRAAGGDRSDRSGGSRSESDDDSYDDRQSRASSSRSDAPRGNRSRGQARAVPRVSRKDQTRATKKVPKVVRPKDAAAGRKKTPEDLEIAVLIAGLQNDMSPKVPALESISPLTSVRAVETPAAGRGRGRGRGGRSPLGFKVQASGATEASAGETAPVSLTNSSHASVASRSNANQIERVWERNELETRRLQDARVKHEAAAAQSHELETRRLQDARVKHEAATAQSRQSDAERKQTAAGLKFQKGKEERDAREKQSAADRAKSKEKRKKKSSRGRARAGKGERQPTQQVDLPKSQSLGLGAVDRFGGADGHFVAVAGR